MVWTTEDNTRILFDMLLGDCPELTMEDNTRSLFDMLDLVLSTTSDLHTLGQQHPCNTSRVPAWIGAESFQSGAKPRGSTGACFGMPPKPRQQG